MNKFMVLMFSICIFAAPVSNSLAQDGPAKKHQPSKYISDHNYNIANLQVRIENFDICVVNSIGYFYCIDKKILGERLDTYLAKPEKILILQGIDELNGSVGNKGPQDILVHCMGDWKGAKVPASIGAIGNEGLKSGNSNAIKDRQLQIRKTGIRSALNNACRAGLSGAAPASNSDYGQQVGNAVAGFDQAISGCRDGRTNPIADGDTNLDLAIDMKKAELKDQARKDIMKDWGNEIVQSVYEGPPIQTQPINLPNIPDSEAAKLAKILRFLADVAAVAAQKAAEAEQLAESRRRADELAALEKAKAEEDKKKADEEAREPQEKEAQQCLEADKCEEPDKTKKMPLPPGENDGTSCASKQARWNRFKDRCALSSWQSYECVAFVRLLNGCPDIKEIYPGPEGDLTCPVSKSEAERQALAAQQQCKKVGLIGRLSPDGGYHCGKMPVAKPGRRIDICRDPRIVASPEQCP
jgi:hypothetical protein